MRGENLDVRMFVVSFLRFSMKRKYDRTNVLYVFFYFLSIFIMADLSKNAQQIMDLVETLTIVELADLVSAMEEKFGVSAAAPVAVMAGGAAGGAAADEEKTSFDVVMTSAGAQKIAVIKVIREITGLGLAEAKALADNGGDIKKGVKKDEAEKIKTQLSEA